MCPQGGSRSDIIWILRKVSRGLAASPLLLLLLQGRHTQKPKLTSLRTKDHVEKETPPTASTKPRAPGKATWALRSCPASGDCDDSSDLRQDQQKNRPAEPCSQNHEPIRLLVSQATKCWDGWLHSKSKYNVTICRHFTNF